MVHNAYNKTATLFLRLLAFVYLIAISSFWVQAPGLIGSHGIIPVAEMMDAVNQHPEFDSFLKIPTLCHLASSDISLHIQCGIGVILAILAMCGFFPILTFAGLWLIYLSLCVAGQTFMSFQWDNLLLEAGFLAIFLTGLAEFFHAKTQGREGQSRILQFIASLRLCVRPSLFSASALGIFSLRLLLFKLMFGSAVVKIASGDVAWWPDLTALIYHYETTCLPVWTGWYAAKFPLWLQQGSCLVMLFLELGVPFLFFTTRRLRCIAFVLQVLLQVVIATTGNYAFFNLLTAVLCVSLWDDGVWDAMRLKFGRGDTQPSSDTSVGGTGATPSALPSRIWKYTIIWPVYTLYLVLSLFILSGQLDRMQARYRPSIHRPWPAAIENIYGVIAPFRSINGYGLFATMTKSRPEIIVEGSNDGIEWKPYEFKWKAGDPLRRPGIVAPHQPRLDWQMWFAALGNFQDTRWFAPFLIRLLEGSEPVIALLDTNPFPNAPPRYIRATLYDYQFSDRTTRKDSGAWWTRTLLGPYCPPGSLQ